jgi:hypothetical protein
LLVLVKKHTAGQWKGCPHCTTAYPADNSMIQRAFLFAPNQPVLPYWRVIPVCYRQ